MLACIYQMYLTLQQIYDLLWNLTCVMCDVSYIKIVFLYIGTLFL